jgi:hypothetical protein
MREQGNERIMRGEARRRDGSAMRGQLDDRRLNNQLA